MPHSITDIESAIVNLSPGDLREFRTWYSEFDATVWDEDLARDAEAGKLDKAAADALSDLAAGRCTEL